MADTTVPVPTRTVVLGMAHEDGTVVASELYPVAEACGLTTDQVRSCLRRLVTEGLFTRTGRAPDTRFAATERGLAALGASYERTRLAYGQDAAGKAWDGVWRLVAFAIPEKQRAARDALRDRVVALGGAPVQSGLYVSPHPWHKDVQAEADRLGVGEHLTLLSTDDLDVGGEHNPRQLARRLWPVDELGARYQRFVDEWSFVPALLEEYKRDHKRIADAEFFPGALATAVAFQQVFDDDPLLPPELLPRPWPGRAARDLLVRNRRMGATLRESHTRPVLFRMYDEAVEVLR